MQNYIDRLINLGLNEEQAKIIYIFMGCHLDTLNAILFVKENTIETID